MHWRHQKRTPVELLQHGHRWYTSDANGSVEVAGYINRMVGRGQFCDSLLIALALTQACRERGQGMVYVLFSVPTRPDKSVCTSDEYEAYSLQASVPALVYVPEGWSTERQVEWDTMTPFEQVHRCWAPHGWVHPEVAVLPFDAVVEREGPERGEGQGFCGELTAPVIVLVTPALYVGVAAEMRLVCQSSSSTTTDGSTVTRWNQVTSWDLFVPWLKKSMEQVVSTLHQLSAEDPSLLSRGGEVNDRVRSAYQKGLSIGRRAKALRLEEHIAASASRVAVRTRNETLRDAIADGVVLGEVGQDILGMMETDVASDVDMDELSPASK